MDPIQLAVNAAMAMLDRYGGLWSSDHDHVRQQLTMIMEDLAELADDYPGRDEAARRRLQDMLRNDIAPA